MSVGYKTIILPSRKEIMSRLIAVDSDEHMVADLYPLIAQEAGRRLVAEGVVIMLAQKIYEFVRSGYSPQFEGILHGCYVQKWIDALVDDKEVAERAKKAHQDTMDASRFKAKR